MILESVEGGILGPCPERERLTASIIVPKFVRLKIGASVVLTKNLSDFDELANGSVGKVVDFSTADDLNTDNGVVLSRPIRPPGLWPVVEFPCRSGIVHRVLIMPETFSIEGTGGRVLVSRKQVSPFIFSVILDILPFSFH